MLEIENDTPFQADRALLLDGRGNHVWVVIVKATYRVNGDGVAEVDPEQEPVALAPAWAGEAGKSSLRRESEVSIAHPGTDVTFNATAHAPGDKAKQVDVGVMVGSLKRLLRVFGERIWHTSLIGLTASSPQPFDRLPIVWERAYGGTEVLNASTGAFASEPRNPIGRGFATCAKSLAGRPLPNVEDLLHPIRSWRSRPQPAGLGAVDSSWSPRRERAGTFDKTWQRTRMPLLPEDHDPSFYVSAPPGLHSATPLQGGEAVSTVGLTPEGKWAFRLPRERLVVEMQLGRQWLRNPVQLERVIVEPDRRRVVMVWGSRFQCGVRGRQVAKGRVTAKAWVKL